MAHWAVAFRAFCGPIKRTEWYSIYLKEGGPTRAELMRLALLEGGVDDPALAGRLGEAYGRLRDAALQLFPESLEVLDAFRAKGYPLALITNGPADIQRQEIATCGIETYFDLVLIEGEMGFGKPDRRVFDRAATHFGVQPEEMLMIGNSYSHDIKGAIQAGWRTFWIRRETDIAPSTNAPEERPADGPVPDLEADDLRAILQLLEAR